MIRWLLRWYWRGWAREYELAIMAEIHRHTMHEETLRRYRWEIVRLRQNIERAGGRPTKRAQPLLSGIKPRTQQEKSA